MCERERANCFALYSMYSLFCALTQKWGLIRFAALDELTENTATFLCVIVCVCVCVSVSVSVRERERERQRERERESERQRERDKDRERRERRERSSAR